jgi:hypothetical protein
MFAEDSETILSRFARQEAFNMFYQSRLDSDTSPCYDLLQEISMEELGQENKCNQ